MNLEEHEKKFKKLLKNRIETEELIYSLIYGLYDEFNWYVSLRIAEMIKDLQFKHLEIESIIYPNILKEYHENINKINKNDIILLLIQTPILSSELHYIEDLRKKGGHLILIGTDNIPDFEYSNSFSCEVNFPKIIKEVEKEKRILNFNLLINTSKYDILLYYPNKKLINLYHQFRRRHFQFFVC